MNACESRNVPLKDILLLGDNKGVSPLHHAAALQYTKCLAFMLKHLNEGSVDPEDHKKVSTFLGTGY